MAKTLEIYWGSGSPNAWRVMLTAELKKIPYESKLLEFSKEDHKKPEFVALNPRGKVPVIRDGDFTLYESLAIMAYLDRRNPEPPIFGRNAAESGRIWRTISEFECYLRQPFDDMLRPILFKQLPEKNKQVQAASETVRAELGRLEQSMDSNPWLCGGEVSAADLAAYPFVKFMVRLTGKDELKPLNLGLAPFESKFPKLQPWMKRVEALPGYERAYPPHWRSQ
jgi:glutathione S-transferase